MSPIEIQERPVNIRSVMLYGACTISALAFLLCIILAVDAFVCKFTYTGCWFG